MGTLSSYPSLDIYGAGAFGRQIADLLRANGQRIRYVYDRSPSETSRTYFKSTHGVELLSALEMPDQSPDVPILNCCFNAGVSNKELNAIIVKAGREPLSPNRFYRELSHNAKDWNYWLDDAQNLTSSFGEIQKVRDWLQDDKSKSLWSDVCEFRIGDWKSEPKIDSAKQYFPLDLPALCFSEDLRMIDMGACTGDALLNAIESGMSVKSYLCFEPDIDNIKKLKEEALRHVKNEKCMILPLGCSDEVSVSRFSASGSTSSRALREGESSDNQTLITIVTTDLDSVLIESFKPNLIKMDIEGFELKALKGSLNTIRVFKPTIAMAAYHNSMDLIDFMHYIESEEAFSGYQWNIRQHGWNSLETVLYGIPVHS